MSEAFMDLSKLVSLSFDESPDVRKQAAQMLGALDDPAAVFALVELSYDKDPSVREVAQLQLDKRKTAEPELMSFAEMFSSGAKKPEQKPGEKRDVPSTSKEKVLEPITKMFEKKLGKEKAHLVQAKMMPSIEKIYQKALIHKSGKKKDPENGRKVMQEFLTSYLEVMSDLDHIGSGHHEPALEAVHEEIRETEAQEMEDPLPEQEVAKPEQLDSISSEIAVMEACHLEEARHESEIGNLPGTYFKKAYEVMMLSEGDEDIMKKEMRNMIESAKKDITLAFQIAKKRFKEANITHLTEVKDGMRNINTEPLTVNSVESMEYQKTKKQKAQLTRLLVNDDEGNEGVIYLFDDRGLVVNPGMKVKVIKALAKSFKFSGETALSLGQKGSIYIVL